MNTHFRVICVAACLMLWSFGLQFAAGQTSPPTQTSEESIAVLRQKAEIGDAAAQFDLGSAYLMGEGVPKNDEEAMKWYRRAAEQGLAKAQHNLGYRHSTGLGVPKNPTEGVKWYRKAAEQGFAQSQFNLGACYEFGEGLPMDAAEAANWFRKAAEQGHAPAQFLLGDKYVFGKGLSKDSAEGVKWYRKAAEQGLAQAQHNLGYMYASGEGVPKDSAEAARWYRLAAEQGLSSAQTKLAIAYFGGHGVPQSLVQAHVWASLAGARGDDDARKFRDLLAEEMTREQIAEAQRIAAEFKPRVWKADDQQVDGLAVSDVDATGSGFFITSDGYFVTNHHVVADARRIRVRTASGTFPASVIRADATNDIAILKVDGEFKALPVRGSRGLKIADRVATLGFPNPDLQGEAAKYSSGEVAALSGPGDDPRFLQISVPIQPGNSGGPLVDSAGCVVGMIVAQLDKLTTLKLTGNLPENVNYAIKGTILLGVLEAVPGLAEKVRSEPDKPAKDAAEVAKVVEAACGMVLVEK